MSLGSQCASSCVACVMVGLDRVGHKWSGVSDCSGKTIIALSALTENAFDAVLTILHQQCSNMQLKFIGHFPQAVAENSYRASSIKTTSKDSRKVEQFRSRCQEEMKEEGMVKMNKSKVEPVSKWRCPRQAGSFKVHRRVVWSWIFLLFGEVQEDQAHKEIAREVHPDLQDGTPWIKEGMTIWEDWCLKRIREKNSQGEEPRTLEESSKGGNVSTRQIHSHRKDPRTLEAPVKRWRGSEKVERKEVEKEEEEKEEKSEARKKLLVSERKE